MMMRALPFTWKKRKKLKGPSASTIVLDCRAFSFSARQKKPGGQ
jgi:hypothetical protein